MYGIDILLDVKRREITDEISGVYERASGRPILDTRLVALIARRSWKQINLMGATRHKKGSQRIESLQEKR